MKVITIEGQKGWAYSCHECCGKGVSVISFETDIPYEDEDGFYTADICGACLTKALKLILDGEINGTMSEQRKGAAIEYRKDTRENDR